MIGQLAQQAKNPTLQNIRLDSLEELSGGFRWDLSSRSLIMTQLIGQRDAQEPALLIERGSIYYDRYATELRTSFD